jgi:alpha-L-fucosidase
VIINSRLQGYGDYATPEQGLPVFPPENPYWELCMTMNDSWGYQPNDKEYKSSNLIIRIFIDCISMGGNLLLDIGPKADGTIPDEQVKILQDLGRWTSKHQEAIYNTIAGIPKDYYYGPSTMSEDSSVLYLFVPGKPEGPVLVKGLKNKVASVWIVGHGTKLNHEVYLKPWWSSTPGLIAIEVPEYVVDEEVTVIGVLLDGPVKLGK